MPLTPFNRDEAIIKKSPAQGNEPYFSTGQNKETIIAWEVWNSRYRRQAVVLTKVVNDETTAVFRTHSKLASELQTDDSFTFRGYTYSVQEIHPVKTSLNLKSTDYEISVK